MIPELNGEEDLPGNFLVGSKTYGFAALIPTRTALILFSSTGLHPKHGKILATRGSIDGGDQPATVSDILTLVRMPAISRLLKSAMTRAGARVRARKLPDDLAPFVPWPPDRDAA